MLLVVLLTGYLWRRYSSSTTSSTTCELVADLLGLACQSHNVITADGHVLTLSHIAGSLPGATPILFLHGVGDSSATFVLSGHHSIVHALHRAGHDCWLLDFRGRPPFQHQTLLQSDTAYWQFSIDEMIDFDLPIALQYVYTRTGREIAILGHSQGGLVGVLSVVTHAAVKPLVSSLVLFAAPLSGMRGRVALPHVPTAAEAWVNPVLVTSVMRFTAAIFCWYFPGLCATSICRAGGCSSADNYDLHTVARVFEYYPREASMRNFQHITQNYEHKSDDYQRYDYGEIDNMKVYNQPKPPTIDTSLLTKPVAIFYGANDGFVPMQELGKTATKLSHVVKWKQATDYGHGCFIWSEDAKTQIFPNVLQFIQNHTHG